MIDNNISNEILKEYSKERLNNNGNESLREV